ncbi:5'/3'-nucleotidase SurE [Lichenibacterium ramalinae]|uniref:5'-nucleotidase SurE n=1 Tax=Lichenibacterium ramalinae TaxID=2316527 RepID=A0A4Q2RAZ6_9HYPH|nr:5'/3'-nucleotidase SurE [Lichenibacterium ramalinae]RYB03396.1 5'/3'-nucleotidase SurE [Lichenibacterium ramalinae]
MRILITNDDGIHAPGLAVLERVARQLSDDVVVVAPETDQSGVAHSLSLNDPLRLREVSEGRYAIKGTPTDCVIMAVNTILEGRRPDLILSGINRGQNVAEDVTYSGTIAAAMEGTLLGVPSIALSQAYGPDTGRQNPHWDCGEAHAAETVRRILDVGIPSGTLVNVNFPNCPAEAVAGLEVTTQGLRDTALMQVHAREDGRGNPYYWIGFARGTFTPVEGSDLEALRHRRISVTPLRLDLTDRDTHARYVKAFG